LFRYGKGNPCVNPIGLNISHNREENRTLRYVVSLLNQAKAVTVSVKEDRLKRSQRGDHPLSPASVIWRGGAQPARNQSSLLNCL